jgi:hypothetical protein
MIGYVRSFPALVISRALKNGCSERFNPKRIPDWSIIAPNNYLGWTIAFCTMYQIFIRALERKNIKLWDFNRYKAILGLGIIIFVYVWFRDNILMIRVGTTGPVHNFNTINKKVSKSHDTASLQYNIYTSKYCGIIHLCKYFAILYISKFWPSLILQIHCTSILTPN